MFPDAKLLESNKINSNFNTLKIKSNENIIEINHFIENIFEKLQNLENIFDIEKLEIEFKKIPAEDKIKPIINIKYPKGLAKVDFLRRLNKNSLFDSLELAIPITAPEIKAFHAAIAIFVGLIND